MPHLNEPKTLAFPQSAAAAATAAAAALEPEDVAAVELSVRGLAVLPAALTSPDERLPWLPTPLLLALYVGHAAAAAAASAAAAPGAAGSAPRASALAGLADAATAAVRVTLTLPLEPWPKTQP